MLLERAQSMSTALAFSPQMFVLTAPIEISYTCVLDPVVYQLHLFIDLSYLLYWSALPSCSAVCNNLPLCSTRCNEHADFQDAVASPSENPVWVGFFLSSLCLFFILLIPPVRSIPRSLQKQDIIHVLISCDALSFKSPSFLHSLHLSPCLAVCLAHSSPAVHFLCFPFSGVIFYPE